jgi:hypothetical protein
MGPQLSTIKERPRSHADLKICGAAAQSSKIVEGIRLQITDAIDNLGFLEIEMGVRQRVGDFVAEFVNLLDCH